MCWVRSAWTVKSNEVTVAGEPVALTLKEYELLRKAYGESEYCSDKR